MSEQGSPVSRFTTLTDDIMWQEAAQRLHTAAERISGGEWFDSFPPIQLWNLYLVACNFYYNHPYISIMPDHRFDLMCRYLLVRYDLIKKVIRNKELFTKDRLKAGTGFDLTYPQPIYVISQYYWRIR